MTASKSSGPPLGASAIFGQTMAILVRRLPALAVLAIVPAAGVQAVGYTALEEAERIARLLVIPGFGSLPSLFAGILFVTTVAPFCLLATLAVTARAACDAAAGRPIRVLRGLADGGRMLGQLFALSLLWGTAAMLALALTIYLPAVAVVLGSILVLPALPVAVTTAMAVPVMAIEGTGVAGFTRSHALIRGYRIATLGMLLALAAASGVLFIALAVTWDGALERLIPVLQAMLPWLPGYPLRPVLWLTVSLAVGLAPLYVGVALIYVRLREIQDGTGPESLTAVFA